MGLRCGASADRDASARDALGHFLEPGAFVESQRGRLAARRVYECGSESYVRRELCG
jgi:hypothetical protein